MDTGTRQQLLAALDSIHFATRHLDQAASVLDRLQGPLDARVKVAQAIACSARAGAELARSLPPESEASRPVDVPFPF